MNRRHAFTLIELLVVISIIALLVGILLPALGAARETAIKASCLSNLRQLTIGFVNYTTDNDGFFPITDTPADGYTPAVAYYEVRPARVQSYFGENYDKNDYEGQMKPDIYFCPAYPRTGGFPGYVLPQESRSYGYNNYLADDNNYLDNIGGNYSNLVPTRASDIRRPSRLIALYDGPYARGFWMHYYVLDITPNHLGDEAANVSFADGHVETFRNFDKYFQVWKYETLEEYDVNMNPKTP
jgi:prepilin-type N-terminal cleavage/methylation domain-containing protein/prepilin-type processing-associated H-X9-DG protein